MAEEITLENILQDGIGSHIKTKQETNQKNIVIIYNLEYKKNLRNYI